MCNPTIITTVGELISHLRALGNKEIKPLQQDLGLCNEIKLMADETIKEVFRRVLDTWAQETNVSDRYPIEGSSKSYIANRYKWAGCAQNNRRLQMCLDIADRLEEECRRDIKSLILNPSEDCIPF